MKCIVLSFILSLLTVVSTWAEPSKSVHIECDGITVTFGSPDWLTVDVDNIPFSIYSDLTVVNENWTKYFFSYDHSNNLMDSVHVTTNSLSVNLIGEGNEFIGKQTVEILDGRVLRNTLSGKMTTDTVARINYMFTSIQPGWVSGNQYKITDHDGNTTTTCFPKIPKRLNYENARLCKNFSVLEVDSKLGKYTIKASSNGFPVSCLDYRNNTWDNSKLHLLIGIPDYHYRSQDEIEVSIEVHFPQKLNISSDQERDATTGTYQSDNILTPAPVWDVILPTPKSYQHISGLWTKKVPVTITANTRDGRQIAARFCSHINERYHNSIKMTKSDDADINFKMVTDDSLSTAGAYNLKISKDTIFVQANSVEGLDNAEKTLRQVVYRNQNQLSAQCLDIHDYPSLPFRALHCFFAKDALTFQKHFFRNVFPILKINHIVYETSYLKWNSCKYLRNLNAGMKISDAKAIVKIAKDEMIDLIPLVNTYGHSEWLLGYPETKHLADDPENIYAYDATNPEVYKICEAIYEECISIFKPSTIHIGHDEITAKDFPKRQAAKRIGAQNLILKDIFHWHDFLKARNIRTMMWGDMLLYLNEAPDSVNARSQEEANALRSQLPKDILINDWHYAPTDPEKYISLAIFNDAGFDTVAASWNSPENILNLAKEAQRQHIISIKEEKHGKTLGTMQTVWAGYNFDKKAVEKERHQFVYYIPAAEAAWNDNVDDIDSFPYSYQEAFTRLYGDSLYPSHGKLSGWAIDLEHIKNVSMKDIGLTKIPEKGSRCYDLNTSRPLCGGVAFSDIFATYGNAYDKLTIDTKNSDSCDHLLFIVATPFSGSDKLPIAKTTITFKDNKTEAIDWVIGKNILGLNDSRDTSDMPTMAYYRGQHGVTPASYIHGYIYPFRGSRQVKNIIFESTKNGPPLVLFDIIGYKQN